MENIAKWKSLEKSGKIFFFVMYLDVFQPTKSNLSFFPDLFV